jgi:hypothetical protein
MNFPPAPSDSDFKAVYKRPRPAAFKKMWETAHFSFDANVLLHIYRYNADTRKNLLDVMSKLGNRVWVSHQACHEFYDHRFETIKEQFKTLKTFAVAISGFRKGLNGTEGRGNAYVPNKERNSIEKKCAELETLLESLSAAEDSALADDTHLTELEAIMNGRVGSPFTQADYATVYELGAKRFAADFPPGYKDKVKGGNRQYGDVVMWFQLIEHAQASKLPLILITDDDKEDWWLISEGKKIGPRAELVNEFKLETKQPFHAYSVAEFLRQADEFLAHKSSEKALEEAEAVEKEMATKETLANAALKVANSTFGMSPYVIANLAKFEAEQTKFIGSLQLPGLGLVNDVAKAVGYITPGAGFFSGVYEAAGLSAVKDAAANIGRLVAMMPESNLYDPSLKAGIASLGGYNESIVPLLKTLGDTLPHRAISAEKPPLENLPNADEETASV